MSSLKELGTQVLVVTDGLKAFELSQQSGVELIVLVEPLPVLSGLSVCSALREAHVTAPILLLCSPETLTTGLDAGADCALPEESDDERVQAQVRALLRRVVLDRSPLRIADLSLDTNTRCAERAGKVIRLSATEYTLLELLMRRAGRVVSREEILEHVWLGESRASDNVLDVYVSYLRTKIDRDFPVALIRTVRSQGYMIAAG
ncbi:response regulator transcription factor [Armatimonas sp.]|uniref:response regulator transcription factor n=1 Tax=Armatimonas sp. TaxID=1872638 RepID=UPI0037507FDF